MRSGQRTLLSPPLYGGGPPPSGSGWVTSPRLSSGVRPIFTAVLLLYGTDDLSSGREPCLLRHTGGSVTPTSFRRRRALYSAGSMDRTSPPSRGGDVVFYVFAPDTSQLRGGHRLRPGGLATVIRQDLAPLELGLVLRPTCLVLALRRPFFMPLYVNVNASKAWTFTSLSLQFHRPS